MFQRYKQPHRRHEQGPPRVLILSENESVPSDRRVWDISLALVDAGFEVTVVCPQGDPKTRAGADEQALREVRNGVSVRRYRPRFAEAGIWGYVREYATAFWRTRRLVRALAAEGPIDVVHACNPPDFLLFAAWSARRRGARLIFDHHDLTPELFLTRFGAGHRILHRLTLILERACFSAADVVIATNESYREIAITRGGKRREDVFVVRNGPELERFRDGAPDPALKRGRPLLIGYLGVMAPQDGVDHALRALALVARRRDDWHAIFAGDGEARPGLIALAQELGLGERVEFSGWVDDRQISQLLSTCDVCLAPEPPSPLNDRSTMVKIAEYMAMGCPIVAYPLSESRFTAAGAALYARPNDIASMASCIEELLDDPEQREEMGRIGRERVEQELSWEHSQRTLAEAYRTALGSRAPASSPRAVALQSP